MVTVLLIYLMTSITKPELFYWKLCLVSQETAVFTPYLVIRITVTAFSCCAWVVHPACALTTSRRRSTPICHLRRITRHPPSVWTVKPETWVVALVLDELFTVWRDTGETGQLRQTRSFVMNVTFVTAFIFISSHICPALTVVTDDCHANTLLICHVTVHYEWCQSSIAIWVNLIVFADTANVFLDLRTGSSEWISTVKSISKVTSPTFAWIGSTFIGTFGKGMTRVGLPFTFIEI